MQPPIPWSSSVSVFVIERTSIINFLKCTVLFSLVVPLLPIAVTHRYLLSLVVLLLVTLCHLLHHSLSFVVTRRTTRCHSLSFVVTRCTTRCHSLPLVVTRCTTRLSFYKPSVKTQGKCDESVSNEFKIMRKSNSLHQIIRMSK